MKRFVSVLIIVLLFLLVFISCGAVAPNLVIARI